MRRKAGTVTKMSGDYNPNYESYYKMPFNLMVKALETRSADDWNLIKVYSIINYEAARMRSNRAYLSVRDIAYRTKLSKAAVQTALTALEKDAYFFSVLKGRGSLPSTYILPAYGGKAIVGVGMVEVNETANASTDNGLNNSAEFNKILQEIEERKKAKKA